MKIFLTAAISLLLAWVIMSNFPIPQIKILELEPALSTLEEVASEIQSTEPKGEDDTTPNPKYEASSPLDFKEV